MSAPPVQFDESGLVPAVIQDAQSGDVLMVAFMNEAALQATRETGRTHFWSRRRGKLWRKGETSGHEQIVRDIYVNCELNSLLIKVDQIGAVCNEGYPTCYYRRVDDDNALTFVRDRVFDPDKVYGKAGVSDSLVALTELWYRAYVYLREHDLSTVSGTSKRLRSTTTGIEVRIADELNELAGVLDGSHGHDELHSDVILEGSQVLYWVCLLAVSQGTTWDQLRPDRALLTGEAGLSSATTAAMLRAEAASWSGDSDGAAADAAARCHATFALVGQACRSARVDPAELIRHDLADLKAKSYLREYFDGAPGM